MAIRQQTIQRLPESHCRGDPGIHVEKAPVGHYHSGTLLTGPEYFVHGIPPMASRCQKQEMESENRRLPATRARRHETAAERLRERPGCVGARD